MDAWGGRVGGALGLVADTTKETTAFYYDVDRAWHIEFNTPAEGVDVNLFVLGDDGFAQVHADTPAEGIETGTMEWLAMKDILIAAIVYAAYDSFAVFVNGNLAL